MKQDGWTRFIEQCHRLRSVDEIQVFFDVFFTYSEKIEFGKRFLIVQELLHGKKTQREIAKDLKVSIANVSRGSNTLKSCEDDFKQLLQI